MNRFFEVDLKVGSANDIHEHLFGSYPYVAPEIFKVNVNETKQDPYTKYSDVYSLGVLLWQISSGKFPFENQSKYAVMISVAEGLREERAPDTPDGYYDLYSGCWVNEPEKRHTIEYVYDTLEILLKNVNDDEKVVKTDGDGKKTVKEEEEDDVSEGRFL